VETANPVSYCGLRHTQVSVESGLIPQAKYQSPQVMLVLATAEHLTKLRLLPPSSPRKSMETFLVGHILGHRKQPGNTSQCLNPFDNAERIPMSTCRKILGLDAAVGLGLGTSGGLGFDAPAARSGDGRGASAVGLGHGRGALAVGLGHRRGTSAAGLGLGATGELRIGLNVPVCGLNIGLDAPSRFALGLGSSIAPGLVNLGNSEGNEFSMHEQTTGRDNLKKRPQVTGAHRIWVEEKPMDSAYQVSYRKAIVGLRLGRSDAVSDAIGGIL